MMDKSQEYIKMCETAEEIQKAWDCGKIGDYYVEWHPKKGSGPLENIYYHYSVELSGCNDEYPNPDLFRTVWLPRQDQLQEMIKGYNPYDLAHYFPRIVEIIDPKRKMKSMEQLWLCFAMYEKYNEIWNGQEWIKE